VHGCQLSADGVAANPREDPVEDPEVVPEFAGELLEHPRSSTAVAATRAVRACLM
jgi:hypothetical protein